MKLGFRLVRNFSHTYELSKEFNDYQRQDIFEQLSNHNNKIFQGYLEKGGSYDFVNKFEPSNFKKLINNNDLALSSVGVGTYKGSFSEEDDLSMFNGLIDSVNMGVNVIDTCSNFRAGRSQKIIGMALQHLINKQGYTRNNFLISSKAGYVRENMPSSIQQKDVINDHCVHPFYLEHSLNKSLDQMGLKTLDVFYLNNFAQSQLQEIGQQEFEKKLIAFFTFAQNMRKQEKIKYYGLSSWQAFRVAPNNPNHLNLKNIVKIAQKVGGSKHGFKFIQVPINVMMPQAFAQKNQPSGSLLQTAEDLQINVVSNSPLMNGSLINIPLPAHKLKCRNNGAKHLQLIRSIPSSSLVTTLIGQKRNRHVKKNLQVFSSLPLSQQQWTDVFFPSHNANPIEEQYESEDE